MGRWWDRKKAFDAGTYFLKTGSSSALDALGYRNVGGSSSSGGIRGGSSTRFGRCRNSEDCASGFGCVDGECIQTGGSEGNVSGTSNVDCGDSGGGGGGGGCGGGGSSGCSQPSCAGGGTGGRGGGAPEDCCGERCCRYGDFGVMCYCGPCPPPQRCQKYCDAFYKINKRYAEGCGNPTVCTECETCRKVQGFWTECVPANDAPCQCEQSKCSQCEKCEEDGSCETDCEACQTCVIMNNIDCGCKYISAKCCNGACEGTPDFIKCKAQVCAEACPEPPGVCGQQCDTITVPCPCPSGYNQVGQISAGGETVCICQDCSDDPNCDPEPCDCNCNNDCGDCEICDAAGRCVPDPKCDCQVERVRYNLIKDSYTISQAGDYSDGYCCSSPITYPEQSELRTRTMKAPATVRYFDIPPTPLGPNRCGLDEYSMGGVRAEVYDCEGNLAGIEFILGGRACSGDASRTGRIVFE